MGLTVVIGGGIAGISVAAALASRGRDVAVYESEPQLGTQSTGKNAAIFRLAVSDEVNVRLAQRSRELGARLVPGGTVRSIGALYLCDDDARTRFLKSASGAGVRDANPTDFPDFLAPVDRRAVYSPYDGVIDVHALVQALVKEARFGGARFHLGTRVERLERTGGRCTGVVVAGETISAECVIDATGAWTDHAAVRSTRRHLYVLDSPWAGSTRGIVWDTVEGIYLRPESGGLLVSPCDEVTFPATADVPVDPLETQILFEKLSRWAPMLAQATVRRVWSGLRPITQDHRFIVGPDPKLPGLFRMGGFGGHGATAGAAAGEMAASMVCGDAHPDAHLLRPDRFENSLQ